MNPFEKVKGCVTVVDAAQRYGVELGRGGMALCPFHDDHTPSLFIADDHYYCFACGEHGDVVDFTARLFDCRLHEAAQKLAADFRIDTGDDWDKPPNRAIPSRSTEAQQFREKERLCLSVCENYVRLLSDWKADYAPQSPEDEPNVRYVEAFRYLDRYEYYIDLLISGCGYERTELVEMLTADDKLTRLKTHTEKYRRKREHHGRDY